MALRSRQKVTFKPSDLNIRPTDFANILTETSSVTTLLHAVSSTECRSAKRYTIIVSIVDAGDLHPCPDWGTPAGCINGDECVFDHIQPETGVTPVRPASITMPGAASFNEPSTSAPRACCNQLEVASSCVHPQTDGEAHARAQIAAALAEVLKCHMRIAGLLPPPRLPQRRK